MAFRPLPVLRLLRTSSPLRQSLASPLGPQLSAARRAAWASPTIRHAHSIPKPPPQNPFAARPASPSKADPPSASTSPPSQNGGANSDSDDVPPPEPTKPDSYQLVFTCRPCGTRSSHMVSKQGYHHGSVLVSCPGCKNRHVISDQLGIFGDKKTNVEEIIRAQGGIVRKGSLGEDGDIEFWPDEGGDGMEKK